MEVGKIRRKRLHRFRGNTGIELVRFAESLVQERLRAEHAIIRQRAAAEQNAICSDKTIIADAHRRRCLTIAFEIDAVSENLRSKAGEGGELPDRDRVRAIDQMAMRDGGMLIHN